MRGGQVITITTGNVARVTMIMMIVVRARVVTKSSLVNQEIENWK